MKKAILILCVVALVVSLATSAMASSTYWAVKFRVGGYDGSTIVDGSTVNLAGMPALSQSVAPDPTNTSANISSRTGAEGAYSFWATDKQVSGLTSYTFTLELATGTLFSSANQQVYITAWTPDKSATTLNITGRAIPTDWTVRVQGTGVDVTWTQAQLLRSTDAATGAVGPVGFWFTPSNRSDAWVPITGKGVDLFTVTIAGAPVPEPGSMLALGSGLLGLAGFAIRRRRA